VRAKYISSDLGCLLQDFTVIISSALAPPLVLSKAKTKACATTHVSSVYSLIGVRVIDFHLHIWQKCTPEFEIVMLKLVYTRITAFWKYCFSYSFQWKGNSRLPVKCIEIEDFNSEMICRQRSVDCCRWFSYLHTWSIKLIFQSSGLFMTSFHCLILSWLTISEFWSFCSLSLMVN
jgi:hypothetical protein